MSKLFLSFLGTSDYKPCFYGVPAHLVQRVSEKNPKNSLSNSEESSLQEVDSVDDRREVVERIWTEKPMEFVQEALVRNLCLDWQKGDRVIIATTKDARAKNWAKKDDEDGGTLNLQECLTQATKGSEIEVSNLDIPDGFDENELWKLFEILSGVIHENDQIYFDITHSFKSLPMLGFAVLEHARSLKNARVCGILYGPFEATRIKDGRKAADGSKKEKIDVRRVPILDFTPLWTSHRWSVGINSFIKYGQAGGLLDVIEEVLERNKPQGKKEPKYSSLKKLKNYIELFSNAHLLANLPALVGLQADKQDLEKTLLEIDRLMNKALVGPLFMRLRDDNKAYKASAGDRILNGIKWCLKHELYPQAMTLAREAVDTAACVELGLPYWWDINSTKGRKLARNVVGALIAKEKDNLNVDDKIKLGELKAKWGDDVSLLQQIKSKRNDLNHAGFKDEGRARKLAEGKKSVSFESYINDINENCNDLTNSRILSVLKGWDGSVDGGRGPSEEEAVEGGRKMLCLLNHPLTEEQRAQAKEELGVDEIVFPPNEVSEAFAQIPPEEADVSSHLRGVVEWVREKGREGDYLLVQGEFGATYGLVRFAQSQGMRAVHATTKREAEEVVLEDGTVSTKRVFRHVLFREYGPIGTLC